jgi:hypothetical protein
VTVRTKSVAVTPLRNFPDNLNPTTPGNTMLIGCHYHIAHNISITAVTKLHHVLLLPITLSQVRRTHNSLPSLQRRENFCAPHPQQTITILLAKPGAIEN